MKSFVALVCFLTFLPPRAFASSGDESWEFRTCVATCRQTGCATAEGRRKNTTDTTLTEEIKEIMTDFASVNYCSPLCDAKNKVYQHADTFWLKLSSWECSSDCSYRCMWLLEDQKRRTKAAVAPVAIEKYFGKWPFIRALGAQEPASVLFSILNLVANTVCFFKILDMPQQYRNNIKSSIWNTRPSTRSISTSSPSTTAGATSTTISTIQVYYSLWLTHFALSSNAWFWSSIFHCRDTGLTERLDYFSAGALVGFNLFLSVTRVAGVVKLKIFASIGLCILLMYSIHVYRMLNVLFDYGFHVGLCVAAGAVQTAVWLAWALGSKYGKSHPGKVYLLSFMAAVNVAMLLEILDFPPLWKMIDAHALWHAATAPLTVLWYRFVAADVALLLGSRSSYKTKS
jgi:hypothetical protein